jgi:hypothetical protein
MIYGGDVVRAFVPPRLLLVVGRRQRRVDPAEAAAPESAERLLEVRFLYAAGVLVGRSGGMKNSKSWLFWY